MKSLEFDFSIIDTLVKIKIGFDLHGVIDRNPLRFKYKMAELRNAGHDVLVISGPPRDQIIQELSAFNIELGWQVDEVYSIVDYLKEKGVPMKQDENKNWWASDAIWWSAKALICREHRVDYMLDDTFAYAAWFATTNTHFIHVIDGKHNPHDGWPNKLFP